MTVYKDLLDKMTWSYSRLTAYEHCPYHWYLKYIEGQDGEGSFYAENGKIMHGILDELIKGTLSIYDAPTEYLERFNEIENTTKQSIMDKTYDSCVNYLDNLDENILDGYHVVGSEIKLDFLVYGYRFVGIIDLLLQDENDNLIVVDHKSSDPFLKKNGEPYASTKEQFENYKRQMGLYCYGLAQVFDERPTKIVFNHFKSGKLTVLPVSERLIDDSVNWCLGVIEKIYKDDTFEPLTKTGFCYRLCDYRSDCDYLKEDEYDE